MRVAIACTVALTFAASATSVSARTMPDMPGMAASAVKAGKGVGVVQALDPRAATVTIKHGPIPAVGWPAMTMTFKATPPALLKGIRVGETIAFDVRARGMSAAITAIRAR